MTPQELRAAAERVMKTKGESIQSVYGKPSWVPYDRDCESLADAYLAEHPSDEDELVTVEWIKRVIPEDPDHPNHGETKHAGHSISWIEWDSRLCVYVNHEGIYWQDMTRRRFRALAYGMGVPLKEKS